MDTGKAHTTEIKWEVLLKKEEIAAGKTVASMLNPKHPIQWERAGDEKQIILDSNKDPYQGCCSADPRTQTSIHTDGALVYKTAFSLPSGDMRNFQVSNYNYILIKHHIPGKTQDSKHQSVIVKKRDLKHYIRHLLRLNFY